MQQGHRADPTRPCSWGCHGDDLILVLLTAPGALLGAPQEPSAPATPLQGPAAGRDWGPQGDTGALGGLCSQHPPPPRDNLTDETWLYKEKIVIGQLLNN